MRATPRLPESWRTGDAYPKHVRATMRKYVRGEARALLIGNKWFCVAFLDDADATERHPLTGKQVPRRWWARAHRIVGAGDTLDEMCWHLRTMSPQSVARLGLRFRVTRAPGQVARELHIVDSAGVQLDGLPTLGPGRKGALS